MRRNCLAFAMVCLPLLAGACGEPDDGIREYTHPKDKDVWDQNHPPEKPAEWKRLHALMVVDKATTWFFKISGPDAKVDPQKFAQLIATVTFKDGKPEWKAPEGWSEVPASDPRNRGMRIGTVLTGADGDRDAPELTITTLGTPPTFTEADWILNNVNRWRGVVGMAGVTTETLYRDATPQSKAAGRVEECTRKTSDGRTWITVNLRGKAPAGGPRMLPFLQR